jgi:hypothetical protein
MEAGKFSFKFSRQTQKNLVGSSKYAYFSATDGSASKKKKADDERPRGFDRRDVFRVTGGYEKFLVQI